MKKQSQFVPGLNGIKSYVKGDYDRNPLCGAQENKANLSLREQSQSQTDMRLTEPDRREVSTALRTSH